MQDYIQYIRTYYLPNVSWFSGEYEGKEEYQRLKKILSHNLAQWDLLLDFLVDHFGEDRVEDRTDGQVSNILLLHARERSEYYVSAFFISKISPFFCYHTTRATEIVYPDFDSNIFHYSENVPYQISSEVDIVVRQINGFFPRYQLAHFDLNERIMELGTRGNDIGEATAFNLLFSDYIF